MGDRQKIKGTSNSTIIQVEGDLIQQGLSADEVRTICREVIADEISRHSELGKKECEDRFNTIVEKILDKLTSLENDLSHRFEDPGVQMSTYDLIKSYIRVGDESLGDEMVDMLMDRLKETGRTVNSAVIDEAIQILPKLSEQAVSFLALKVFSVVIVPGDRKLLQSYFEGLKNDVESASNVSKLDIAYLKQVGCCSGTQGIVSSRSLGSHLLDSYDLYFRHAISLDELTASINRQEKAIDDQDKMTSLRFILSMLDSNVEGVNRFRLSATKHLDLNIQAYKMEKCRSVFEEIKASMNMYTEEELREELSSITPAWRVLLDRYAQSDVTSLQLTPVGYYIGRKRLGKIIPMDIELDFFYQ